MTLPNQLANIAILWDMDGVLVDTGQAHYQAWVEICAGLGINLTWEGFVRTFGMDNNGTLATILGQPQTPEFVAEVSERKETAFRRNIHGRVILLPGVTRWLAEMSKRGILQAVASSAPIENIDLILDETGIRPYFTAIVSSSNLPGKPNPAVFLEAARTLGVSPASCIVIEDSLAGVEAANRAGMRCIAVTNTYPRSRLSAASVVVESLEELKISNFC